MKSPDVELWKNTANGLRWYFDYDVRGVEVTKSVSGGRSFSISVLARQSNQERASGDRDLFRNGTFVLMREAEQTARAEIDSPESLTDAEIHDMVMNFMGKSITIHDLIGGIESSQTLARIYEQLVLEDASKTAIETVKAKMSSKEATVPVERVVVSTSPDRG